MFVGGEGKPYPVMEEGKCFIEIPDRRFSWADWDGKLDFETLEEAEQIKGYEVAGIAQLAADNGRAVLDKAHRPESGGICVVWAADGKQQRIVQTLIVEELTPQERAIHRKALEKDGDPIIKPKSKRKPRPSKTGVMWTPNQKRFIVEHMVALAAKRTPILKGRAICFATLSWIPKQKELEGVRIPAFSTLQGWLKEKGIRTH